MRKGPGVTILFSLNLSAGLRQTGFPYTGLKCWFLEFSFLPSQGTLTTAFSMPLLRAFPSCSLTLRQVL